MMCIIPREMNTYNLCNQDPASKQSKLSFPIKKDATDKNFIAHLNSASYRTVICFG